MNKLNMNKLEVIIPVPPSAIADIRAIFGDIEDFQVAQIYRHTLEEFFFAIESPYQEWLKQEVELINETILEKKREFIFNFKGGGWNTVWAKNQKEAIKLALKEYSESPYTQVDVSTVRLASSKMIEAAMSTFY